ncbi:hypothetical protein BU14_1661s0002, partial [Porphyra umbilicalis]
LGFGGGGSLRGRGGGGGGGGRPADGEDEEEGFARRSVGGGDGGGAGDSQDSFLTQPRLSNAAGRGVPGAAPAAAAGVRGGAPAAAVAAATAAAAAAAAAAAPPPPVGAGADAPAGGRRVDAAGRRGPSNAALAAALDCFHCQAFARRRAQGDQDLYIQFASGCVRHGHRHRAPALPPTWHAVSFPETETQPPPASVQGPAAATAVAQAPPLVGVPAAARSATVAGDTDRGPL